MSEAALAAALAAPLIELGVDVESVEIQQAGRRHVVRVVIDRDGGVDLDLVAAVSQRVSELLDVEPLASVVPGPFVLEVSSPGTDRPLTEVRHWRRAVGRLVHATGPDGVTVAGRLVRVDDEATAVILVDDAEILLPIEGSRAVVQVEFRSTSDAKDSDAKDSDPEDSDPEE